MVYQARRKEISDYHKLAKARGLKFVGSVAPYRTRDSCNWECLNCGRIIHTSYSNLITADHGCRCQISAVVSESQYHDAARRLSLEWRGQKQPKNARESTRWYSLTTKTEFEASYSDLVYHRPVKRELRIYIARNEDD